VQTTQLNAAQLMGEFLGSEHGKITRKIVSSGFSEELRAQHSNCVGGSAAPAATDTMRSALNDNCANPGNMEGLPGAGQLGRVAPAFNQMAKQEQNNTSSHQVSHSATTKRTMKDHLDSLDGRRPVAVSAEKTQEQLVFTDGLLVEKLITQLQLPAEQHAAVQAAADSSGRISLKALTKILNDPANRKSTSLAQPEVTAESVQQLVDTLSQVKEKTIDPQAAGFQLKSKGSYNLREVKGLLNHIVSRAAQEQQTAANDNLIGAQSSALSGTDKTLKSPAAATSSAALQRPTHDLVPSFSLANTTRGNNEEPQATVYRLPRQEPKTQELTRQLQQQPEENIVGEPRRQISESAPVVRLAGLGPGEQVQSLVREELLPLSSKSNAVPVNSAERESFPHPLKLDAKAQQNELSNTPLQHSQAGQTVSSKGLRASNIQGSLLTGEEQGSMTRKLVGESQRYEMNTILDKELSDTVGNQIKIKAGSSTEGASSQKQGMMHEEFSSQPQFGKTAVGPHNDRFMPAVPTEPQTGNPGSLMDTGETLPRNQISLNESGWEVKLAQRIQSIHGQDRNHLTLELEPKELGRLSVRIETQQNQVTAFIVADSERARALLVQNSSLLQNSLQEQGLMLDQISVDIRQQSSEQQTSQQLHYQRKRRAGAAAVSAVNRPITLAQPIYQQNNGDQIISLFT